MAAALVTNAAVTQSGTTALFTAPYPQAIVVFVTAVGGAITLGDANVAAGRGISIASGTTFQLADYENFVSLEQLFFVGPGNAQVSYLKVVG